MIEQKSVEKMVTQLKSTCQMMAVTVYLKSNKLTAIFNTILIYSLVNKMRKEAYFTDVTYLAEHKSDPKEMKKYWLQKMFTLKTV